MLRITLEPQEVQLAIQAINNAQIMGKDAHLVSNTLKKFEDKLASLQEVNPQ